jgi:hypothetical protein
LTRGQRDGTSGERHSNDTATAATTATSGHVNIDDSDKRRQRATATADTAATSSHFVDIDSNKRDVHDEDQDEDKKADDAASISTQWSTHQQ